MSIEGLANVIAGRSPPAPVGTIIPDLHLPTYLAAASPKVAIMGDSTSTVSANVLYPSETIWELLERELRRQNPDKTHSFSNFGIGGANFSHFNMTGTASGLTLPSWFTDPALTWRSYVEAFAPDLLFICAGINQSNAPQMQHIRTFFQNLVTWTPIPDVVFITNKASNPFGSNPTILAARPWQPAMSAAVRHLVRSQANGMGVASLPKLGMIDAGRYYFQAAEGYDPCDQYLALMDSAAAEGIVAFPYDLPECDGDFDLAVSFPGQGSSLFTGGATGLQFVIAPYESGGTPLNRVELGYSAPNITTKYWCENFSLTGTPVAAGADLDARVLVRDERIIVLVNGTVALDEMAPRYQMRTQPEVRITGSPPGDTSMDVVHYRPGRRRSATWQTSNDVWGTDTDDGNGINHLSSLGVRFLDAAVIGAQRFR